MRFVIGLMLGLMLGASLGSLPATQGGGETIRVVGESIQQRGEGTLARTTVYASNARTRKGRLPAP